MRILRKNFHKHSGYVVLVPINDQDLWHAYNLIVPGDYFKMSTFRKVISSTTTGVKNVQKKRTTIKIIVRSVEYFAKNDSLTIEIKGRNMEENDFLQIGKHHSFSLEMDVPFTIYKTQWDRYHRNIIREIEDETTDCEVGAIVMDVGIAHICYLKTFMTLTKQKIERNIPKKGAGKLNSQKLINKFYEECFKGLISMDHERLKCIIIGSPGYVRQYFFDYIKKELQHQSYKQHSSLLPKILLVHTHSGFKSSLVEALQEQTVKTRLKNTKAMRESKILDDFYKMLMKNSQRVAYGEKDVCRCFNEKAIQSLLISDALFRTKDLKKRRQYSDLVEKVREVGGQAYIFSSLHPSGEKLNSISGIAAILNFEVILDDEPFQDEEVEKQEPEQLVEENEEQEKQALKQLEGDDDYDFM